jgi:hypothetical protein
MRKKTVKNITATLADVSYPTADYATPFTVGNECVLCIAKTANYAGGVLHIETDNSSDGSFSDIHAAADSDAGKAGQADFMTYNVTLGDNIRIGTGTVTAGECEIFLLGNT